MNLKLHLRNGEEPITFEEAKIFIPKKEDGVVKHKYIAYIEVLKPLHQCHSDLED